MIAMVWTGPKTSGFGKPSIGIADVPWCEVGCTSHEYLIRIWLTPSTPEQGTLKLRGEAFKELHREWALSCNCLLSASAGTLRGSFRTTF